MRVLLMLPYAWNTGPSQRYRIEQWKPWLATQGVEFETVTLLSAAQQRLLYSPGQTLRKALMMAGAMLNRVGQMRGTSKYDAIWLHRAAWPIGPALLEKRLASSRVPLIFEFDDAIYLTHTSQANRRFRFLKFAHKTSQICSMASHVVVGNNYLAEYARQFNPSVTVIPTTIDTDLYQPRAVYEDRRPVTIGWSGSGTTLPHLRLLDSALRRVAADVAIQLQAIGVTDYTLPGVQTRSVAWQPDRQVEELSHFDIGVMPMPDEEWARGKCACKALEYMAVGVPTIASPVGVNAQIIRDGENGLLASTDDEWVDKLLLLIRDVALRQRLGQAGRQTVEACYSAQVQAPRVLHLLHEVCKSS